MSDLKAEIDDLLLEPRAFDAVAKRVSSEVSPTIAPWIFTATLDFLNKKFNAAFDENSIKTWEKNLFVGWSQPHIKWWPMPEGVKKICWRVNYYEGSVSVAGLVVYPEGATVQGGEGSWQGVVEGSGAREFTGIEVTLTDIEDASDDENMVSYGWLSNEENKDGLAIRSLAEAYCMDRICKWSDQLKELDRMNHFEFEIVVSRNGQAELAIEL